MRAGNDDGHNHRLHTFEFARRAIRQGSVLGNGRVMSATWLLGYWLSRPEMLRGWLSGIAAMDLGDSFRLAAVWACLLGVYGLTLPSTPPSASPSGRAAPLLALRLLRRTPFVVYFVC